MFSLLLLGAVSFFLSLVITPVVGEMFRRGKILDYPDLERKHHPRPVPRVGGIAIALSYGLAFIVLLLTHSSGAAIVRSAFPFLLKLVPPAAIILLTGLVDDILGLRAWQKMVGQFVGALIAYLAGIQISTIGSLPASAHFQHWWSLPVTVLWLIACMNAFNLIDGLDGLAAGIGLVTSITTLLVALIQLNIPLALAIMPLAGCLLGFLYYNFNPASIFLGDSGSLFVGFLLGCFAVVWSEKSATLIGMAAPLMALGVPLLDTMLAVGRRFLRGTSIFSPDRGHIHHRLLDLGLTPREAVLRLYGFGAIFALLALVLANHGQEVLVLGIFCLAVWIGVQRLQYVEFNVAARLLSQGWLQHTVNAQILLRNFEARLNEAETPEQCWTVLRDSYRSFGFVEIFAQFGSKTFCEFPQVEPRSWCVDIALGPESRVTLGARQSKNSQEICSAYVDAIRNVLETKLAKLTKPESLASDTTEVVAGAGLEPQLVEASL
ncbi:MAG TPA: MraY family glycosyltransferase [Bryobacteraceae bacterium]|nr:MraY family glycosyltransferase [Bryobacteraceae bacterium]